MELPSIRRSGIACIPGDSEYRLVTGGMDTPPQPQPEAA